ncbi:hypothetical protein BC940DRAFT_297586 [Gongronella butleri]|nr:hypothetical protein BC940DRAFT_297586 [Gongronella butleri]
MKFSIVSIATVAMAAQVMASGPIAGCKQTYTVKAGDSCEGIAASYKLTPDEFYAMNPGLHHAGAHLCDNLDDGKPYCVCTKTPCASPAAAPSGASNSTASGAASSGAASASASVSAPASGSASIVPVSGSASGSGSAASASASTAKSAANSGASLSMVATALGAVAMVAVAFA